MPRLFVPSKNPAYPFEDIVANIRRIEFHVEGIADETAFPESATVYDAVERCLERISEAASKLGAEAESLCPEILWSRIRELGNVLRHESDRVEGARIWYTIKDDLPDLKAASEKVLRSLREDGAWLG